MMSDGFRESCPGTERLRRALYHDLQECVEQRGGSEQWGVSSEQWVSGRWADGR